MKYRIAVVLGLIAAIAAHADVGIENQKDSLNSLTQDYSNKYKCPINWSLIEKNLSLPSEHSRGQVAKMVAGVEYEIRLACQRGGFDKINKVVISCGTAAADKDNCTDTQKSDGASVKLSGKTLNVAGKYKNCHCSGDAAEEGIKKVLAN